MNKLAVILLCLWFLITSVAASAAEWTMGGNYQFSYKNPFGTGKVLTIGFSVAPSVMLSSVHEVGMNLGLNLTKTTTLNPTTMAEISSTTSVFSPSAFYRFNVQLSGEGAAVPLVGYIGPQLGLTSVSSGGASSTDFSFGGGGGLNFMFSKNFALNVHVLQLDMILDTDPDLVISNSVGVKYYF